MSIMNVQGGRIGLISGINRILGGCKDRNVSFFKIQRPLNFKGPQSIRLQVAVVLLIIQRALFC